MNNADALPKSDFVSPFAAIRENSMPLKRLHAGADHEHARAGQQVTMPDHTWRRRAGAAAAGTAATERAPARTRATAQGGVGWRRRTDRRPVAVRGMGGGDRGAHRMWLQTPRLIVAGGRLVRSGRSALAKPYRSP